MRKKAKAIALTKTKPETRTVLLAFLSLIILFGVLFYFHSLPSSDLNTWTRSIEYDVPPAP